MTLWRPSRRALLKTSAISAAVTLIGTPRIVRADPKEVVVGGPAGAAKYFNSDVFPAHRKEARDQGDLRGDELTDQPAENER